MGDKRALERIRQIRQLDKDHNFTLVCRDLSDISLYARVENQVYRLLKSLTPGPYTFILPATKEVPRRLQHPKRKTIGLRIPDNAILLSLLETIGEPLMTATLILPGDPMPLTDPYEIREILNHQVDLVIDGGYCGFEPTTVVDMVDEHPQIIREGKGVEALLGHK
jgi:tRNA threonylcarbamoyl adenosine modification protein (Sua5/YciO/YrdC/YwlC family)